MSRYIDADALKKSYGMADECSDCVTNSRDCQFNFTFTKMDFCGWIDDAPTADVVEVVRCKYCTHGAEDFDKFLCEWNQEYHNGDWFCADGERRDDEQGLRGTH